MKRFVLVAFILVMSLLFADTVTFAVGEWAPFISEKLPNYGATGEIVIEAFKTQNVEVKFLFYPWERSRMMVEKGEAVGSFPWYIDKRKDSYASFSTSMFKGQEVFFYRKTQFPNGLSFDVLDELNSYNIGGIRGYKHLGLLKDAGITNIDISSSSNSAMKKLEKGRIDLVPENELVGWAIIDQMFPTEKSKFGTTSKPLSEGTMHVMFSKNNPNSMKYQKMFEKGLEELRKQGKIDKILSKYK
jgi:polar amino acid transport system substrate-binding protein